MPPFCVTERRVYSQTGDAGDASPVSTAPPSITPVPPTRQLLPGSTAAMVVGRA